MNYAAAVTNCRWLETLTLRKNLLPRSVNFLILTEIRSGEKALGVLRDSCNNNSIDLVITDWQMDGMNGVEICNKIRDDSTYSK
ncbi:MAG: response regulator, partial [Desulfobulbaceae bacterium]|nr:response regulator [Desulfobulbaceae bacterium]